MMHTGDMDNDIQAMRMGVDYTFPVRLRSFQVALRPLANSEMIKCYQDVSIYMASLPAAARSKIAEDNALAREFLKAASSPFGQYAPRITDAMMDQMTTDEVMFLYREWMSICEKVNPALEKMPADQLKSIVDILKKNPVTDLDSQLTELSFYQLRSLVTFLLTSGD